MSLSKILLWSVAPALCLGSVAVSVLPPSIGVAAWMPSSVMMLRASEDPDPAFGEKFKKALAQNAKNEMTKLVKEQPEDAVAWIVRTGEQISDRPSAELEALMSGLREAWKNAIKTEFAERSYTFFTNLGANRRDRIDLRQRYDKALIEYKGNLQQKDSFVFQNVIDEIEILASAFEQIGDHYFSSEGWEVYAECNDEKLRAAAADLHKAYNGYSKVIEQREAADLKDALYDGAVKRKAELLAKGADKRQEPRAPDAPPPPTAEAGAPLTVPMTFEVVASLDAFLRPIFTADEIFSLWAPIPLKAKGSSATLATLPGAPQLVRVGANDVRIDTNGDGQGDEKLPPIGNITPIKIPLGVGADARPYAFLGVTGSDKENYQGMSMNIAPSDAQLSIYTFGASSIVGTINNAAVRINDDTLDGVYGSKPQTWGYPGLSKDNFQPDMDSIVIGASKRARPWSEFQEIDGKWFRLEVNPSGKELKATPVVPELGHLKLDYKGPAPTWVVVNGQAEGKDSYFDLVEGGAKGVNVPVGKYKLYYGELRKGKKRQVQKTLILPGRNTPTYEVKKGETTVVTLGAPYSFDFRFTYADEKLTVEGPSVVVVGSQGERYERPWACVPEPEVAWRKKGTTRASKPERLKPVTDVAYVEKQGWAATWAPMDLTVDCKGAGAAVEVQLTQKKHDFFGKIDSDWKE